MNFEELKKEMNQAAEDQSFDISRVGINGGGANPVAKIRRNMKREIIVQLVAILIFMIYPIYIAMPEFSEAVYYVFMFITSLMTMAYILKLSFFLRKTTGFTLNTKSALTHFIYEAKLTLEVYKSFVIAGSLLLPVPVFALLAGYRMAGTNYLFEKWFLLDVNTAQLVGIVIGYIIVAFTFYYVTITWTKWLYGKYVSKLEQIVADLEA